MIYSVVCRQCASLVTDAVQNTLPEMMSLSALPVEDDTVRIVEVSPRDGLQNINQRIPTEIKIELIEKLARCGLRCIRATSFVSPKWIPQLDDAAAVLRSATIRAHPDVDLPVLVPNLHGLQRALASGSREIVLFLSASESFSLRNINCTISQSLSRAAEVAKQARKHGLQMRGVVSCVFSCPYDGPTNPLRVLRVVQHLLQLGCYEVALGDTLGKARPKKSRI